MLPRIPAGGSPTGTWKDCRRHKAFSLYAVVLVFAMVEVAHAQNILLTPNYFLLDQDDAFSSVGYSVSADAGLVAHGRRGLASGFVLEKPESRLHADLEGDPVAMGVAFPAGLSQKPGVLASSRGPLAAFGADRGVSVLLATDASCISEADCWKQCGFLNHTQLTWSNEGSGEREIQSVELRSLALGRGVLALGLRAEHPDFVASSGGGPSGNSGSGAAPTDESVFVSVFKLMPSTRCPRSPTADGTWDSSLDRAVASQEMYPGVDLCSPPFALTGEQAIRAVADPLDLELTGTTEMPSASQNGTGVAAGPDQQEPGHLAEPRSMAWGRVWHGTRLDAWPDAPPVRHSAEDSGFGEALAVREHLVAVGAPAANEVHLLRAAPYGALLQDGDANERVPDAERLLGGASGAGVGTPLPSGNGTSGNTDDRHVPRHPAWRGRRFGDEWAPSDAPLRLSGAASYGGADGTVISGEENFGASVALTERFLIVGAPLHWEVRTAASGGDWGTGGINYGAAFVFDTPWRFSNRSKDLHGQPLSEGQASVNPVLDGDGAWIPGGRPAVSADGSLSVAPDGDELQPTYVRAIGASSAVTDPVLLLVAGSTRAREGLDLPLLFLRGGASATASARQGTNASGTATNVSDGSSSPALPGLPTAIPGYLGIPNGSGASWVGAGASVQTPLPRAALIEGAWRRWKPDRALRPVCRMAGASVDGRLGTAVAAEDDTDPGAHSWGNSGASWAARAPELRWTGGSTLVTLSAPRANRGLFVRVDDASGICSLRHQITGFLMGSEKDFGLSNALASGMSYFGAPTAQTSNVRTNGKPGRLYVTAYCHSNFHIRWPPVVNYLRQCDPCGEGRQSTGGISTSSSACLQCPVAAPREPISYDNRPAAGAQWMGSGAGCRFACDEGRFGPACEECPAYMESVSERLEAAGLGHLAPVLPPRASWIPGPSSLEGSGEEQSLGGGAVGEGPGLAVSTKCGWRCWPEFDLNLSASAAEDACVPPAPPLPVARLIAASEKRSGSLRLVLEEPSTSPKAPIIAWRAKITARNGAEAGVVRELPAASASLSATDSVAFLVALAASAPSDDAPLPPPEELAAVEVAGLLAGTTYVVQLSAGNAGGFAEYGSVTSAEVTTSAEAVAPGAPGELRVDPLSGGLAAATLGLGSRPGGDNILQIRVCVALVAGDSNEAPVANASLNQWPVAERMPPAGPCDSILTFGVSEGWPSPGMAALAEAEGDLLAPAIQMPGSAPPFVAVQVDRFGVGQEMRASFVLRGLEAEARYVARAILASEAGAGTASEWSDPFQQPAVTLPTEVRNLTCSPSPGGRIRLDWERPLDDGGMLLRYAVHFGLESGWDGSDGQQSPTSPATGFFHTVDVAADQKGTELVGADIVVNYTYVVRVRAETGAGPGPTQNRTLICSPGPISPPSHPTVPLGSNPSASTVLVSWAVPDDMGGAIASSVRYAVVVVPVGQQGGSDEPILKPDGSLGRGAWIATVVEGSFTRIGGLNHSSEYQFAVVAENSAGRGPLSQVTQPISTLPASAPGAPGRPHAVAITGGSITLQWSPPIETGGAGLVASHIEESEDSVQWRPVGRVAPSDTTTVIGRLGAKTPHFFRVIAEGTLGLSPPSSRSIRIDTTEVSSPGPALLPMRTWSFERECAIPGAVQQEGAATVPCPPVANTTSKAQASPSGIMSEAILRQQLRAAVVRGTTDAVQLPRWMRVALTSSLPAAGSGSRSNGALTEPIELAVGTRTGPTLAMEAMAPIDDGGATPGGVALLLSGSPAGVPVPGLDPEQRSALSLAAARAASVVASKDQLQSTALLQRLVTSQWGDGFSDGDATDAAAHLLVADAPRSCPAGDVLSACTVDSSWVGGSLVRSNRTAGDVSMGISPVVGVRVRGLVRGWDYAMSAAITSSDPDLWSSFSAAGNFSSQRLQVSIDDDSGNFEMAEAQHPAPPTSVGASSQVGGSLTVRWHCDPEAGAGSPVVGFVLLVSRLDRMLDTGAIRSVDLPGRFVGGAMVSGTIPQPESSASASLVVPSARVLWEKSNETMVDSRTTADSYPIGQFKSMLRGESTAAIRVQHHVSGGSVPDSFFGAGLAALSARQGTMRDATAKACLSTATRAASLFSDGDLTNDTATDFVQRFAPAERLCLRWVASHPLPQGEDLEYTLSGLRGGRDFAIAIASVSLEGGVSAASDAVIARAPVATSPARPPYPPALVSGGLGSRGRQGNQASGRRRIEATDDSSSSSAASRVVLDGREPNEPIEAPGLSSIAGGGHVWLRLAEATSGGLPVTHQVVELVELIWGDMALALEQQAGFDASSLASSGAYQAAAEGVYASRGLARRVVGGGAVEGAPGNRTDLVLVSGLRAGGTYAARSRAVNMAGVSPASAWSPPLRTDPSGGTPGPVGAAAASLNGTSGVVVAWTAPNWRGGLPIQAYSIRFVSKAVGDLAGMTFTAGAVLPSPDTLTHEQQQRAVVGQVLCPSIPTVVGASSPFSVGGGVGDSQLQAWHMLDATSTANITAQAGTLAHKGRATLGSLAASSLWQLQNNSLPASVHEQQQQSWDNDTWLAAWQASEYGGGVATFVDGPGWAPLSVHAMGSRLHFPSEVELAAGDDTLMQARVATQFDSGSAHVPRAASVAGTNRTVLFAMLPADSLPPGQEYAVVISAVTLAGEGPGRIAAIPTGGVQQLGAAVSRADAQATNVLSYGISSLSLSGADSPAISVDSSNTTLRIPASVSGEQSAVQPDVARPTILDMEAAVVTTENDDIEGLEEIVLRASPGMQIAQLSSNRTANSPAPSRALRIRVEVDPLQVANTGGVLLTIEAASWDSGGILKSTYNVSVPLQSEWLRWQQLGLRISSAGSNESVRQSDLISPRKGVPVATQLGILVNSKSAAGLLLDGRSADLSQVNSLSSIDMLDLPAMLGSVNGSSASTWESAVRTQLLNYPERHAFDVTIEFDISMLDAAASFNVSAQSLAPFQSGTGAAVLSSSSVVALQDAVNATSPVSSPPSAAAALSSPVCPDILTVVFADPTGGARANEFQLAVRRRDLATPDSDALAWTESQRDELAFGTVWRQSASRSQAAADLQAILGGTHKHYRLGGACNPSEVASAPGAVANAIAIMQDAGGQALPPTAVRYAFVLEGVPPNAELDVFVSARNSSAMPRQAFGRPVAAVQVEHADTGGTGDVLSALTSMDLRAPLRQFGTRNAILIGDRFAIISPEPPRGSPIFSLNSSLRDLAVTTSSGGGTAEMSWKQLNSSVGTTYRYRPDCVAVWLAGRHGERQDPVDTSAGASAGSNSWVKGTMGFSPMNRVLMARCGWMMLAAPSSASIGGLGANVAYDVAVTPFWSRWSAVGPWAVASIGAGGTDASRNQPMASGSAGAAIVATSSSTTTLQLPPPLWHGGRRPAQVHVVALAIGNSSESFGVLQAAAATEATSSVACELRASNVPIHAAPTTGLCSMCAARQTSYHFGQVMAMEVSSTSGWPSCDPNIASGDAVAFSVIESDVDGSESSVPDAGPGGVGHWAAFSVDLEDGVGPVSQPLRLSGIASSSALVVGAAWSYVSPMSDQNSSSIVPLAEIATNLGLPELVLDVSSASMRQVEANGGGLPALSGSSLSDRIAAAGEAYVRALLSANTSSSSLEDLSVASSPQFFTGPVLSAPQRLGSSSAPIAPDPPAPLSVGPDVAVLLFREPADTGGNAIEAFEIFVEQLEASEAVLHPDAGLVPAAIGNMHSAGLLRITGDGESSLLWNTSAASPAAPVDWSSEAARLQASQAFIVGGASGTGSSEIPGGGGSVRLMGLVAEAASSASTEALADFAGRNETSASAAGSMDEASMSTLLGLSDPLGQWLACTVHGLEADHAYRFAITAVSASGVSEPSAASRAIQTSASVEPSVVESLRIVPSDELGMTASGVDTVPSDGTILEWNLPATTGGRKISGFVVQVARGECGVRGQTATSAGVEQMLSLYVPICGFEESVTYGHPSATSSDYRRMSAVGVGDWPGWASDGTSTSGILCDRPQDAFAPVHGVDTLGITDIPRCACAIEDASVEEVGGNNGGTVLSEAALSSLGSSLGTPLSASSLYGSPVFAQTRFRFALSRLVGGECYENVSVAAVADTGVVGAGLPSLDAGRPALLQAAAVGAAHPWPSVARLWNGRAGNLSFITANPSRSLPPSAPARPDVAGAMSSAMMTSWLGPEVLQGDILLEYRLEGSAILPVVSDGSSGSSDTAVGGGNDAGDFMPYSTVRAPTTRELFSSEEALLLGFTRSSWFLEGRIRNEWPLGSESPLVPASFWPAQPLTRMEANDLRASSAYFWRVIAVGAGAGNSSDETSGFGFNGRRALQSVLPLSDLSDTDGRSSQPSPASFAAFTTEAVDPGIPSLTVSGSAPALVNGSSSVPVSWTNAYSQSGRVFLDVVPPSDLGGQSIVCVEFEFATAGAVTDLPYSRNSGGWAAVDPADFSTVESSSQSVDEAFAAAGMVSPAGSLSGLEAGTWPGAVGTDSRVAPTRRTNAPATHEQWEAISRGVWPWLGPLGLRGAEHGWPARTTLSASAWLATVAERGGAQGPSFSRAPPRLRPDGARRQQQRTRCVMPYSPFLTAGPPVSAANGSEWPQGHPALVQLYDSAQPWKLPGGLGAEEAMYLLQESVASAADNDYVGNSGGYSPASFAELAQRWEAIDAAAPGGAFSDPTYLDGMNASVRAAESFRWPGPGAARRNPLRVAVDVQASTLLYARARVTTGLLVPRQIGGTDGGQPTSGSGQPWRRQLASGSPQQEADPEGVQGRETLASRTPQQCLSGLPVSSSNYTVADLPHGQVLVYPSRDQHYYQQDCPVASSGRRASNLVVDASDLPVAPEYATRRLGDTSGSQYVWEIIDRRQGSFSQGIVILPPVRKPPALPAPWVRPGVAHDSVPLRLGSIASNDGGSPIQAIRIYRSRFLSELPESQRPAQAPLALLPHQGPMPAGAAGAGWSEEVVIYERYDDMEAREMARLMSWSNLTSFYAQELGSASDAPSLPLSTDPAFPHPYSASFPISPAFNATTDQSSGNPVWLADWSLNQDYWNSGGRSASDFSVVDGQQLDFTDVGLRRATTYRYRAEVISAAGWSSGRTDRNGGQMPMDLLQLEVETLPIAPSEPRDIRRDSDLDEPVAIGLSWTPPVDDGGREITDYEVWALRQPEGVRVEGASVVIASAASGSFARVRARIVGLRWGTNHTFQIAAVNSQGAGARSTIISAETLPPRACPSNCSFDLGQGTCHEWDGTCTCALGWALPNCENLAGPEITVDLVVSEDSFAWDSRRNTAAVDGHHKEMPYTQGTGQLPNSTVADIVGQLAAAQGRRRRALLSSEPSESVLDAIRLLGLPSPQTKADAASLRWQNARRAAEATMKQQYGSLWSSAPSVAAVRGGTRSGERQAATLLGDASTTSLGASLNAMHSLAAWYWTMVDTSDESFETRLGETESRMGILKQTKVKRGKTTTDLGLRRASLGRTLHEGHAGEHFMWNLDALQLFLTQLGAALEAGESENRDLASSRRLLLTGSTRIREASGSAGGFGTTALGRDAEATDALWSVRLTLVLMECNSIHVANEDRFYCTSTTDVLNRLRSDFSVLPDLSRLGIRQLAFQHNGGTFTLNPTRTSCELRTTCDTCLAMVAGACGWCQATQTCVPGDGFGPAVANPVCGSQPIVIDEIVSIYGPLAGLDLLPPSLVDQAVQEASVGDASSGSGEPTISLEELLEEDHYDAGFYRHYFAPTSSGRARCPSPCSGLEGCADCNGRLDCGWCEATEECVSVSAIEVQYGLDGSVEGSSSLLFGSSASSPVGSGYLPSSSAQCPGVVLVSEGTCPARRCRQYQSFGECNQDESCGWCSNRTVAISTDRGPYCFEGDSFGPIGGACARGQVYMYRQARSCEVDASEVGACSTCIQQASCGWCETTQQCGTSLFGIDPAIASSLSGDSSGMSRVARGTCPGERFVDQLSLSGGSECPLLQADRREICSSFNQRLSDGLVASEIEALQKGPTQSIEATTCSGCLNIPYCGWCPGVNGTGHCLLMDDAQNLGLRQGDIGYCPAVQAVIDMDGTFGSPTLGGFDLAAIVRPSESAATQVECPARCPQRSLRMNAGGNITHGTPLGAGGLFDSIYKPGDVCTWEIDPLGQYVTQGSTQTVGTSNDHRLNTVTFTAIHLRLQPGDSLSVYTRPRPWMVYEPLSSSSGGSSTDELQSSLLSVPANNDENLLVRYIGGDTEEHPGEGREFTSSDGPYLWIELHAAGTSGIGGGGFHATYSARYESPFNVYLILALVVCVAAGCVILFCGIKRILSYIQEGREGRGLGPPGGFDVEDNDADLAEMEEDAATNGEACPDFVIQSFPAWHHDEDKRGQTPIRDASKDDLLCPISQEEFKKGDPIRILPCKHFFGAEAIDQWLRLRQACPMCKRNATEMYLEWASKVDAGEEDPLKLGPGVKKYKKVTSSMGLHAGSQRAQAASGAGAGGVGVEHDHDTGSSSEEESDFEGMEGGAGGDRGHRAFDEARFSATNPLASAAATAAAARRGSEHGTSSSSRRGGRNPGLPGGVIPSPVSVEEQESVAARLQSLLGRSRGPSVLDAITPRGEREAAQRVERRVRSQVSEADGSERFVNPLAARGQASAAIEEDGEGEAAAAAGARSFSEEKVQEAAGGDRSDEKGGAVSGSRGSALSGSVPLQSSARPSTSTAAGPGGIGGAAAGGGGMATFSATNPLRALAASQGRRRGALGADESGYGEHPADGDAGSRRRTVSMPD